MHSVTEGRITAIRSEVQIKEYRESIDLWSAPHSSLHFLVWGKPRTSSGPGGFTRYAVSTCLNHLKFCPNQSLEVQQRAQTEAVSPKKPRFSPYEATSSSGAAPMYGSLSSSSRSFQMLPPSLPSTRFSSPALNPNLPLQSPTMFALLSPSLQPSPLLSALPSPVTNPLSLPYAGYMPIQCDQSPALISQSLYDEHAAAQISRSVSRSIPPPNREGWSSELQGSFEARIARLTAAAGLPLSWVDNPEWIDFVHQFLPWATSPSRKVLTTRLIPHAAKSYQQIAKEASRGQNATIQADGWTGLNFHHLLAFMITVNKKVRSTVRCLKEFLQIVSQGLHDQCA